MKSWVGTGEGRARKCVLCGDQRESVSHTLCDCSAYRSIYSSIFAEVAGKPGK